jgi:RND family efflux transporter MFP subunit
MPAGAGELRDFAGLVEQTSISPLAFEVTGRIVEIAVPEGRPVRKGQLIARVDPEPFELQLRRAEAQYTQLAEDLKRKSVLHDEGILSGTAFDQLTAMVDAARAQRDLARRDLRNTRLVAPFDGRVARRNVEVQQTVQAGFGAFNFENSERLEVGIDVPQGIVERLPTGSVLRAQAWLPERPRDIFELTFRERATQATSPSSSFRLLFSVKPPTDLSLFPGMAMRVRIQVGQPRAESAGFTVPMGALSLTPDGHRRLWRYDSKSGRVHAVPVVLREIRDGEAVVDGALEQGDQVVSGGVQLVTEGEAVKPMDTRK